MGGTAAQTWDGWQYHLGIIATKASARGIECSIERSIERSIKCAMERSIEWPMECPDVSASMDGIRRRLVIEQWPWRCCQMAHYYN